MEYEERAYAPVTRLPTWLRTTSVILGGGFMIWAFMKLYSTAWDYERMAVLSTVTMRILLPVVVTGFFLWTLVLAVLAAGQWPATESTRTIVKAIGGLALAWILAYTYVTTSSVPGESTGNLELLIAGCVLIIAYVGIAAVAREGWLLLIMPAATVVLAYIVLSWGQLATNNGEYGGVEHDLAMVFVIVFIWLIMIPASMTLTLLGLFLGRIFLEE